MNEETPGKLLQIARERKFLTQAQLAEKVGVAKFSIHRWEHDVTIPRPYARQRLTRLLGIDGEIFLQAERQRKKRRNSDSEVKDTSVKQEEEKAEEANIFKVYEGRRELVQTRYGDWVRVVRVTVNGEPLPSFWHGPYGRVINPEREGVFEWGYYGTGPGNLAAAILADYFGEKEEWGARGKHYEAVKYAHDFMREVIGYLPHKDTDEWQITSIEITRWLEKKREEEDKLEVEGGG